MQIYYPAFYEKQDKAGFVFPSLTRRGCMIFVWSQDDHENNCDLPHLTISCFPIKFFLWVLIDCLFMVTPDQMAGL